MTFLPPIVAFRTASVTWTDWIARLAVGHRAGVGGGVERRVECEQRGDALRGVAGRDDDEPLVLADLRRLLGGEADVRVVGQQQDLAGAGEAGDPEQLAGARVVRLAAVEDLVDAELLVDLREAVAGDDRDDRRARPERRVLGGAVRGRLDGRRGLRAIRDPRELGRPGLRTSRAWLSRFSTLILLMLPSPRP